VGKYFSALFDSYWLSVPWDIPLVNPAGLTAVMSAFKAKTLCLFDEASPFKGILTQALGEGFNLCLAPVQGVDTGQNFLCLEAAEFHVSVGVSGNNLIDV
jgi:hypothetical protein